MPRKLSQYSASALTHSGKVYYDLDRTSSYMHPSIVSILSKVAAATPASYGIGGARDSGGGGVGSAAAALAAASVGGEHRSTPPGGITPLRPLLHGMRMVKSEAEAALMRKSAGVAAAGLEHCIRGTRAGVGEWELAAAFGED